MKQSPNNNNNNNNNSFNPHSTWIGSISWYCRAAFNAFVMLYPGDVERYFGSIRYIYIRSWAIAWILGTGVAWTIPRLTENKALRRAASYAPLISSLPHYPIETVTACLFKTCSDDFLDYVYKALSKEYKENKIVNEGFAVLELITRLAARVFANLSTNPDRIARLELFDIATLDLFEKSSVANVDLFEKIPGAPSSSPPQVNKDEQDMKPIRDSRSDPNNNNYPLISLIINFGNNRNIRVSVESTKSENKNEIPENQDKTSQQQFPELLKIYECSEGKVTCSKLAWALWLLHGSKNHGPEVARKVKNDFFLWAKENPISFSKRELNKHIDRTYKM